MIVDLILIVLFFSEMINIFFLFTHRRHGMIVDDEIVLAHILEEMCLPVTKDMVNISL